MNDVPKPLVSIVIPTCDRREIIARGLEALAQQTYANLEVIVVDDFSADGTPEMLDEMAGRHLRLHLRCLQNESHLGANPSRNRGIEAAGGEFVAFLDSDCIAEPDWLERLLAGFASERVAAVSGRVVDLPPTNIYELTFKGTHRLHRDGPAHRLVAGNMCVRRPLLLKYRLDEDRATPLRNTDGRPETGVSGRGDEEGLYLLLRAAGYEMRIVTDAVVRHEHPLDRRRFFRQAFRGGRSAARLVYKYYLPQRIDMLPFLLTYLTVPLMLLHPWLAAVPSFFFAGALAAITYNDLVRKGKTVGETLRTFPLLLVFYHVRLAGYALELLRLRLTRHGLTRVRLDRVPREAPPAEPA